MPLLASSASEDDERDARHAEHNSAHAAPRAALDAACSADERDQRRRRRHDERGVARARSSDALDEEELIDAVPEEAEREEGDAVPPGWQRQPSHGDDDD